MLDPVLSELSEEYKGKIKFFKLNVFESSSNREIALSHGVMGTPTLMFFCQGKSIQTSVGLIQKDRLKNVFDDILATHSECVKQITEL